MSMSKTTKIYDFIDTIEETIIAVLLGLMTLITFSNVVARYLFNDNILWALEATVFMFAWLVLLGASYAVKHSVHIGVDVLLQTFPDGLRKIVSLIAAGLCIAFAVLLLKGSWEYWSPFIGKRAFLETNDIPMPGFLQFFATWLNDGELYEKMPRFIPYAVLPLSMAMLTYRLLQAFWRILTNQQTMLISSHEGEELVEEFIANTLSEKDVKSSPKSGS